MQYAIITDVHANYPALQAVDDDVRRRRASSEEAIAYWFLGDLVGYGPQPVECVRWLRYAAHIGHRWVPGNHDEWLILPDEKSISHDALSSLRWHRQLLGEPENEELGTWFKDEVRAATHMDTIHGEEARSLVVETHDGLTVLFTHASAVQGMRRGSYLYPWKPELLDEFQRLAARDEAARGPVVMFCGHTHYPMWARYTPETGVTFQSLKYRRPTPLGEGLMILNPGSVGQPRDGDIRAAYLLLDTQAKTVEFRRVDYDVAETISALQMQEEAHYPAQLAARLLSANGGINGQEFQRFYRRPEWDLEAVG